MISEVINFLFKTFQQLFYFLANSEIWWFAVGVVFYPVIRRLIKALCRIFSL